MGAVLGFEYAQEYAEQVRRLFYGDAPGGPVPPGIILASDRLEWAVLRGEIPLLVSNAQAAVAAQFSFVQITCGPPKERAAVITALFVQSGAAAIKLGLLPTPLATSSSQRATSRDLRRSSLVTFAGINSQAADPFPSQAGLQIPAGGFFLPIPPTVIGNPGNTQVPDAFVIMSATVNLPITVYAWGYERRLRPEEQALD